MKLDTCNDISINFELFLCKNRQFLPYELNVSAAITSQVHNNSTNHGFSFQTGVLCFWCFRTAVLMPNTQ